MVHHVVHRVARLAAVGAIALATVAVASPGAVPVYALHGGATLDPLSVDRFVTGYLERTGLPGAAVAITRGTDVVHVAGYGRDSAGAPVTERTPLPIASLSKSFTALAIMQLVDRGHVDLDAPVRDYLPDFTVSDPRGAAITVRQLLNHRSGMSDMTFREKRLPQPDSLAAAVTRLRQADLASAPGSAFHYHNPDYHVAARLVEVVSGEPFAVYLARHVFGPLGMNASTTVGDLRDAPYVARGHISLYGRAVALPEPHWFLDGGSGVVTTAEDLARWLILQTNAGRAVDGAQVVSTAGLDELLTPSVAGDDHALGWDVDAPDEGSPQIGHSGWMFTFTADMVLIPESGYGIAVVVNRGLALAPSDGEAITQGLVAMSQGDAPESPRPVGLIIDVILGILTLLTIAWGIRAVTRSRSWARQRTDSPVWRSALGSLPWFVPMALLPGLRTLASWAFGGRDGTWLQILYLGPTLVLLLAVAAGFGTAVVGARAAQLGRLRRSRSDGRGAEPPVRCSGWHAAERHEPR